MKKNTLLRSALGLALTIGIANNASAQNLIAHYAFEDDTTDATGAWNLSPRVGFEGTLTYETGKIGKAITGFAVTDFLETSTDFAISGNDSRTMTAWVKDAAGGSAILGLGSPFNEQGVSENFRRFSFLFNGANLRAEIQGTGFNGGGPVDFTVWKHVAITYDNSTGAAVTYIDGVQVATATWATVNTLPSPLYVGNDRNKKPDTIITNEQGRGFQGLLDEVRIYDGALTASQIQGIYDGSSLSTDNPLAGVSLKVSPNPVDNILNISSDEVDSVSIYNTLGSVVSVQKNVSNTVDMSSLTQGVYFLKCSNEDGTFKTIRVIKK